MKNYIKDHFFQLITLIPVIFISLGSFILNIYLQMELICNNSHFFKIIINI